MANTLNYYDPIFYAQEALIQLEKTLGMAARVHRGYDMNPQDRGSTINISAPSTFVAQDAPGSAADIKAGGVSVTLDKWKEVRFRLTDKELTFTKEKIIADHIRPAAYAIADVVDQDLAGLYKDVPGFYGTPGTTPTGVSDITGVRKVLQDNNVPDDGRRHLMIDSAAEDKFLQLPAFNQNAGAQGATQETMLRGSIGTRFGMEVFMNQNTPSHVAGTASGYLTNGTQNAGATALAVNTGTGTMVVGDILTVGGNNYTVTTALSGGSVGIFPPLKAQVATGQSVTIKASHKANLAFHPNAFALATAPLSELAGQLGHKIATVNYNGIALRSRLYADGGSSSVYVVLDILYGVKTLNGLLGGRLAG